MTPAGSDANVDRRHRHLTSSTRRLRHHRIRRQHRRTRRGREHHRLERRRRRRRLGPPRRHRRRPTNPGVIQRRRHRHHLRQQHIRPRRISRVGDPIGRRQRQRRRLERPVRHTACVTVGAAGVTSSHDAAVNVTVNVAVTSSTFTHGGSNVPPLQPVRQRRRHRHRRRRPRASYGPAGSAHVGDPRRRRRQLDRRHRHLTSSTRRLRHHRIRRHHRRNTARHCNITG